MLSDGNRKLAEAYFVRPRKGVWEFSDADLNRLLDAARAEGATSLEAELKRRDEALIPFLAVAATIPPAWSDFHRLELVDATTDASDLTAGDFRTLLAALQQNGPDNAG